jgi:hypothetical protein
MAKLLKLHFNDDQQQMLFTGFFRISALLDRAEYLLETAVSGVAFSEYAPDVKPIERAVISDDAARLRRLMQHFQLGRWRACSIDNLADAFDTSVRAMRARQVRVNEPEAGAIHADVERLLTLYAKSAANSREERLT